MMEYDTDILPMYLPRLMREKLPGAESQDLPNGNWLLVWGAETQKREIRGTEQTTLCNYMVFHCLTTESKGREAWCQRGGNEGSSAAHGRGVGREEKPHVLMAVSALSTASNRLFIVFLMYLCICLWYFFPPSKPCFRIHMTWISSQAAALWLKLLIILLLIIIKHSCRVWEGSITSEKPRKICKSWGVGTLNEV